MQAEAGASLISTASGPGHPAPSSSTPDAPRRLRPALAATVVVLGAAVWVLDRLTKNWALDSLTPGVRRPLIGELLQANLLFNPGAAFSFGTGATPVFTFIQAAVALIVLVAAFRVRSRGWAVVLGLVLGGAGGNLYDRLARPPGVGLGHVVDFLELPHWPVFNVADSSICCAAVLVAVLALRGIGFDGSREGGRPEARA